ncbi:hypothetical protein B0H13DRAFT_1599544 [Mycena leptocephala]|nr:hypothetical protein B0H13DRAFT_1599544 [Mycena leptocephala]
MAGFCWKCGAPSTTLKALLNPHPTPLPDFNHLLTSNNVPLDSEIPHVRQIVSDSEDRLIALNTMIAACNAEILRLQDAIEELSESRDVATEQLRQYSAIIPPLRRVPPELVCEIFALSARRDIADNLKPPWRLDRICKLWRQYALSYPALWSTFTMPSHRSSNNERFLSTIKTQLLRSGNGPLDICAPYIRFGSVDPQFKDMITAQSGRWRSLFLRFKSRCKLDWLARAGTTPLLRLERL